MTEVRVVVLKNQTRSIVVGRRGTYSTARVIFDVTYLIEAYGNGTPALLVRRATDTAAYPVNITYSGNEVIWDVSATDTAIKGHGECELYWYVDGGLAKSVIYDFNVYRGIDDSGSEPPEPYESWVDRLIELGTDIQDLMHTAVEAIDADALTARSWAVGGTGIREGEDTDNAKFYSEVAKQGAEHSGYAFFNVNDETGFLEVTVTDQLDEEVSFTVNESTGMLEVNIL